DALPIFGEPGLRLQAEDDRITITLQPRGIGSGEVWLEKETPTRLKIYPVTKELRQIAEILGEGLSVPRTAKAQLVEAIAGIAPLLPIHSDLPELAGHVEQVPADERLYAHLLPLAEGLRLQLLLRPLPEGRAPRPRSRRERPTARP